MQLKGSEGCRLKAYQDERGIWTIGYGHTGPEVVSGLIWTQEQADQKLGERLAREFEPEVALAGPATQTQFDAMVNLCYNIGTHGFKVSSVRRFHLVKDYQHAGDAFLMWDKPADLLPRREREKKLYLTGVYS